MKKITGQELNEAAMKIIMLAGDGRNLLTVAIKNTFSDAEKEAIDESIKQANDKIAEAHHIQTDIIQYTIEEDELQTTLLFSHAQDTLMTVYSESKTVSYMIEMYRRLIDKIGNLEE